MCLSSLPVAGLCDLVGEERAAENMELSDGLLLQVNNGEQWYNRWKHPNEDLVSHQHKLIAVMRVDGSISTDCPVRSKVVNLVFACICSFERFLSSVTPSS